MENTCKEILKNLVESLEGLIDSSEGVAGLHLNGDIAAWESLQRGGKHEEWLIALYDAQNFLGRGPNTAYAIFCNDSIQHVVRGDEKHAKTLMISLKEKYFIKNRWLFGDRDDYETQCLWHIKPTEITEVC